MIECYNPKSNSYISHRTYKFLWQSDSFPSFVNLKFKLVGADSKFGDNEFSVVLPPESMNLKSVASSLSEGVVPRMSKPNCLIPIPKTLNGVNWC